MNFKRIAITTIAACLISCGGGGGGGGGDSRRSAPTGVRVLHAVIDGSPVDLYTSLSPMTVAGSVRFAEEALYSRLPEGTQEIILTQRNSPSVIYTRAEVTIGNREHYTFLYFGNSSIGTGSAVISDQPGEIPDGMAAIKLIHGVVGASMIEGSVAGVATGRAQFGNASPYVFIPAGPANVTVTRTADGLPIAAGVFQLDAGSAYSFFLSGEIDYFVAQHLLPD